MAQESQDREDLLRDATAFVTRVQLSVSIGERTVVVFAGFRTQGAASFYFNQDPVYHFNSTGQLRRAFVDDMLIKAEKGRLVVLQRQRSEDAVEMLAQEMTVEQQQVFCQTTWQQLGALRKAIDAGDYTVEGQAAVDQNENVVDLLRTWLADLLEIDVASSPRVTG